MSFFDPAGVFGGGGGGFRDPLGIFGGGRRQMSPQELAQARGGGGQSIRDGGRREMAFGGAAGPAGGQFEREFADRPQPAGGATFGLENMDIRDRAAHMRAQQAGGPSWGGGALGGMGAAAPQPAPQFGGFGGNKGPALQSGGPAPGAMMQSQGGQQWGQLASALAQQGQPQGMSGGIRRFANTGLQSSADPYGAPRRAMAGVRGGKFSGPRG